MPAPAAGSKTRGGPAAEPPGPARQGRLEDVQKVLTLESQRPSAGIAEELVDLARLFKADRAQFGQQLAQLASDQRANVEAVIADAESKLSAPPVDTDESTGPSARTARKIAEAAIEADTDLRRHYLGGMFAIAKSSSSEDERVVQHVARSDRMTRHQLLSHYSLYLTWHSLLSGQIADFPAWDAQRAGKIARLFVPFSSIEAQFNFGSGDELYAALQALENEEGLISSLQGGDVEFLSKNASLSSEEPGIVINPTARGIELFLWGVGLRDVGVRHFFLVDISDKTVSGVPPFANARIVGEGETES